MRTLAVDRLEKRTLDAGDDVASEVSSGDHPAMEIRLIAPFDKRLTPESAALYLGIGLYVGGEATIVQAAHVAGMTLLQFMRALGERRIPMNYGVKELEEDIATIRSLPPEMFERQ